MADMGTITATVTSPLDVNGNGLRIRADGATQDSVADWTDEFMGTNAKIWSRVQATVRNPVRPIVTGLSQTEAGT